MKRTVWSIILLIAILIGAAACGNDSSNNANLTGEQVYARNCATCHGADLKSGRVADLDKIGSKYTAEEIEEIIQKGFNGMPPAIVKGEDARKVAEWLSEKK